MIQPAISLTLPSLLPRMGSWPGDEQLILEEHSFLTDSGRSPGIEGMDAVYDELRELARHALRRESSGHTLQATALVHEAYVRLAGLHSIEPRDERHLFALAATMIRRVLVDHARTRKRSKRGGGRLKVTLDEALSSEPDPLSTIDLLDLDETLVELARLDPRQARIVELRLFAGFNNGEVAAELATSLRTVEADWAMAKAWLRRRLVSST